MSTTTMHFGPEWMRTKPHNAQTRSSQPPPSPPPIQSANNNSTSVAGIGVGSVGRTSPGGIGASVSGTSINANLTASTPTAMTPTSPANLNANNTNMNTAPSITATASASSVTTAATSTSTSNTNPASTYSALVSSTGVPGGGTPNDKQDEAHPFRYSREELLRIYREGGGKGGLGLEVERWEGVVRETGSDPIGLKEMSEAEKKLWAGSLNSEIRRRQSTVDYSTTGPLISTDRSRLTHTTTPSGTGSPMRERFGPLRRRDSTDSPTLPIPRKQSLSSLQPPSMSPRDTGLPSPRTRVGYTPSFDGVLNSGESWMARRRTSEASKTGGGGVTGQATGTGGGSATAAGGGGTGNGGDYPDGKPLEIPEEEEDEMSKNGSIQQRQQQNRSGGGAADTISATPGDDASLSRDLMAQQQGNANTGLDTSMAQLSINPNGGGNTNVSPAPISAGPPPGLLDPQKVEWSYKDPTGQIQGPFPGELMQKWYEQGYFTTDLPMKRTHIDTQWTTVEELARRAVNDKIFLSQIAHMPPGLSAVAGGGIPGPGATGGGRTESPLQSYSPATEHSPFNAPYQPAPIRSLRSTTLDSYLGNGSNPSDSPSSSFSAGRFSNGSPDPAAFGGRTSNTGYHADIGFGGQGVPNAAFGGPGPSRRNTFSDVGLEPGMNLRSSPFGGPGAGAGAGAGAGVPGRAPGGSVDGYGFNNYSPWGNPVDPSTGHYANLNPAMGALRQDGLGYSPSLEYANVPVGDHMGGGGNAIGDPDKVGGYGTYAGAGGGGLPSIPQGLQYTHAQPPGAQYMLPQQHVNQAMGGGYAQHGGLAQQGQGIPAQSPWGNVSDVHSRRPHQPFDPATSASMQSPITPMHHHHQVPPVSPWGRPAQVMQQQQQQPQELSPWYTNPQGIMDDGRKLDLTRDHNLPLGHLPEQQQHQHQHHLQEHIAAEATQNIVNTVDVNITRNLSVEQGPPQQQQQPPPVTSPIIPTAAREVAPTVVTSPIVSSVPVTAISPSTTAPAPSGVKNRTKSSSSATHHAPTQVQPQSPTSAGGVTHPAVQIQQPQPPSATTTTTPSAAAAGQMQAQARVDATPSPPLPAKAAWSTEETKPSGVTMSLREIQEAEAKKAEARKVAERERAARSAAVASSPSTTVLPAENEDVQSFTTSWGLPTSQAGAARSQNAHASNGGGGAGVGGVGSHLKDGGLGGHHSPSSATSSVASTPWTNAPRPASAKKSMKEIQEEEERRKKQVQAAAVAAKESHNVGLTAAAAAARRGYAETTTKAASPSTASPGNAWTTVGPSGKPSAAANLPARPTLATTLSSSSIAGSAATSRINGAASSTGSTTPASRPTAAATIVKPPQPPAPKQEEIVPGAPSHEFMKWLTDSLKGLNSSVNVEEIMSMLLSFPPDDPATGEIITDLIYANSTTMDGRRYASEFVTKRKADKARGGNVVGGSGGGAGAGSKAAGKAISIADVVKAAPKPTQPEWGGFKVVNKKKKGGRS